MSASSHMSLGVQGACARRAVTHAEGTAERRAVGMGLKLVICSVGKKERACESYQNS